MTEGLLLGAITWMSIVLTWLHLPSPIKNFTKKHPVLSDITASAISYFALSTISKSLVAAVGAISCGLLINFTIMGAKLTDGSRTNN